jgi:hypothetical protein
MGYQPMRTLRVHRHFSDPNTKIEKPQITHMNADPYRLLNDPRSSAFICG